MSDTICTTLDGVSYPGKLDPMELATKPGMLWFDCSTVDSHGRGCIRRRVHDDQRQDDEVEIERVPVPIGILLADALNRLGSEHFEKEYAVYLKNESQKHTEYWIRDYKRLEHEYYEVREELEWRREDSRDLEQARHDFKVLQDRNKRMTKALKRAMARNRPKRIPRSLARIT